MKLLPALAVTCLAIAAARATGLDHHAFQLTDSVAIVEGYGPAPDQYRYLPHLLMVGLAKLIGFRAAVEVIVFAPLLTTFLIILNGRGWPELCCCFIAFVYPLSMYAGARFDTAVYIMLMTVGLYFWEHPRPYMILILILSFSRSDYAMVLALFVLMQSMENKISTTPYVLACLAPLASQIALWSLFARASYNTDIVQAASLSEMLHVPGFWYSAAALAAVGLPKLNRYGVAKVFVLLLFVASVAVVGRPREWRLFLPLVPLAYAIVYPIETKKAATVARAAFEG